MLISVKILKGGECDIEPPAATSLSADRMNLVVSTLDAAGFGSATGVLCPPINQFGDQMNLEVSATASVISVKEIVAQQLRIPVDQQRLVFKGKTLLDSETLCDYNIVEGNKLHLFVREDQPSEPQSSPPDFYEQLQKFLEKHFTPRDAEKVLEEFRKNLSDQLRHLSLDDIERIATFHLDSDHDHNPQVATETTPMQI